MPSGRENTIRWASASLVNLCTVPVDKLDLLEFLEEATSAVVDAINGVAVRVLLGGFEGGGGCASLAGLVSIVDALVREPAELFEGTDLGHVKITKRLGAQLSASTVSSSRMAALMPLARSRRLASNPVLVATVTALTTKAWRIGSGFEFLAQPLLTDVVGDLLDRLPLTVGAVHRRVDVLRPGGPPRGPPPCGRLLLTSNVCGVRVDDG